MPRMTTSQRTTIATPATGLQVYDTTLNTPYYYNGTAWVAGASSSSDTTNDTWVDNAGNTVLSSGNVGIGTTNPIAKLRIDNTYTEGKNYSLDIFTTIDPTGTLVTGWGNTSTKFVTQTDASDTRNHVAGEYLSLMSSFIHRGTGILPASVGSWSRSINSNSGSISYAVGTSAGVGNAGTGSVNTSIAGSFFVQNISTGSITDAYGIRSSVQNFGSGTITNGYGLYLDNVNANNKWSIYATDSTAPSYFAGNIGLGTSTPSEKLHVVGSIRMVDGSQAFGKIMVSDADGKAVWTSPSLALGSSASKWTDDAINTRVALTYLSDNTTVRPTGKEFVVNDNGYVGIGTMNPSEELGVNGNISFGTSTTVGTPRSIQLVGNSGTPYSGKLVFGTDDTGWKYAIAKRNNAITTDLMVIQDNGNIGVGTTTPTVKLEVNGAIKVGDDAGTATPTAGTIRFNSSTNKFEGYDGTTWVAFH